MANTNMLRARGLHTFVNYLSHVPEGALLKAKNVNIDRDGVIEPRRGFGQYGEIGIDETNISKQLVLYKDRVLAHYNDKIAFDNGSGTFTNFTESYTETETGLRIKYVELNGNLYITTNEGIKKIAATSSAALGSATESIAGAVRAADVTGYPNYLTAGFFSEYSKVSYRIAWAKKDINSNLLIGVPSERLEIVNSAAISCNVTLNISVPQDIDDTWSYQVYRTNVAQIADTISPGQLDRLADASSGDEMRLVYEAPYDGISTTITFDDITPEDFRDGGTPLYTNELSGEGISQANARPPYSKDLALFKNSIFFANTKTYQNLSMAMIGTGSLTDFSVSSILQVGPSIEITTTSNHGLTTNDYVVIKGSGDVSVDGTKQVTVTALNKFTYTGTIAGLPIAANTSVYTSYIIISRGVTLERYYFVGRATVWTLDFTTQTILSNDYFELNSLDNEKQYYVWYNVNSTGVDPSLVGKIGIEVALPLGFTNASAAQATSDAIEAGTYDFYCSLPLSGTTLTLSTVTSGQANAPTDNGTGITFATIQNGFGEDVANNYARLSTYASPSQKLDDTARSLSRVINRQSTVVDAHYVSSTTDTPGKFYLEDRLLSDTQFTIVANNDDVGVLFNPEIKDPVDSSNEQAINRIYYSKYSQPEHVPTLNYIDVGPKDKAIVRIIGLRDSLFILKEEGIYRLTGDNSSNFSVTLFDSSANIVAPDTAVVLNNQIYCLTTQGVATITETGVQIISRPIENLILKSTNPNYTHYKTASFAITSESDRSYILFTVDETINQTATIAYRYNTFTSSWTTWEKNVICGIVNPSNNKIYLGASDTNLIEQERKNLSRRDYADRQYTIEYIKYSVINNSVTVSSISNLTVGDVLVQTQYLTIAQVNRLLRKLDMDPTAKHPSITDYFEQSAASYGDDLNDIMVDMTIKLLSRDPGGGYTYTPTVSFANMQTQFNTIINQLNNSTGIFFNNYQTSNDTTDYEFRVITLNNVNKQITTDALPAIIIGPTQLYKAIKTEVVWAPLSFGEVNVMKHVRESTLMFENTALEGAAFGFNTDLSPNFEEILFDLDGDGVFGSSTYDSTTWGGEGTAVPFRTYIPRSKQRCRFIRARFKNSNAFDKFSILGISYTYEGVSERAYK